MGRIEIKYSESSISFEDFNEIENPSIFKTIVEECLKGLDFHKIEELWNEWPMKWWKKFDTALLESIVICAYTAYSRKSYAETEFAIAIYKKFPEAGDCDIEIVIKAPGLVSLTEHQI